MGERYIPSMKVNIEFMQDRLGRGGDHTPFQLEGYAAVRLSTPNEIYANQHHATDTFENMSVPYTTRVAKINAAVMASLDVAVLTSDSESLSNVILEAMAAGLPVVAYGVGGNPELVSSENAKLQRGELIYAGDEAGFAAAVERLLETPSMRAQFGQNARKFAEENFGLENVRSRYEECYRSLLEKKARKKE